MLEYHCGYDINYPEKPERISAPFERCKIYNIVEKCVDIKVTFMSPSIYIYTPSLFADICTPFLVWLGLARPNPKNPSQAKTKGTKVCSLARFLVLVPQAELFLKSFKLKKKNGYGL
jgi:hypothetical protein